jgi:hypothetical protein
MGWEQDTKSNLQYYIYHSRKMNEKFEMDEKKSNFPPKERQMI